VVAAVFFLNITVTGMHYSFGVIVAELMNEFDSGAGETAWIHSIMASMTLLICE